MVEKRNPTVELTLRIKGKEGKKGEKKENEADGLVSGIQPGETQQQHRRET